MKKRYKTKPININKLKSYLGKKPKNKTNARQHTSRISK